MSTNNPPPDAISAPATPAVPPTNARLKPAQLAGVILLAVLLVVVVLLILYNIPGSGFGPRVNASGQTEPARTIWDWLQLIIIPAALALFAVFFNRAQARRAQEAEDQRALAATAAADRRAALDRSLAAERQSYERAIAQVDRYERIMQSYFDTISQLLLDKENGSPERQEKIRVVAQIRTLTVLRTLDKPRQVLVVHFLNDAKWTNVDLQQSNGKAQPFIHLRETDFNGANLGPAELNGADLRESDLSDANLANAELSLADLRRANLSRAALMAANLSGSNASAATLSDAILIATNLRGANLSGADLRSSEMRRANLSDANLVSADLRNTNLSFANCSHADLSLANLRGADLSGADLSSANLNGADLRDANLQNANFEHVQLDQLKLTPEQISQALNLEIIPATP